MARTVFEQTLFREALSLVREKRGDGKMSEQTIRLAVQSALGTVMNRHSVQRESRSYFLRRLTGELSRSVKKDTERSAQLRLAF